MRERDIEEYLRERVRTLGGETRKVTCSPCKTLGGKPAMRERVASLLAYDTATGIFTWKVARGCAAKGSPQ